MWPASRISKWIAVGIAVSTLGWWATRQAWAISKTTCNESVTPVWLTTWDNGEWGFHELVPDSCTSDFPWQPVALWGSDCRNSDCHLQVWRLGMGRTWLAGDIHGIVQVRPEWPLTTGGWWTAGEDWLKPSLETIEYRLTN